MDNTQYIFNDFTVKSKILCEHINYHTVMNNFHEMTTIPIPQWSSSRVKSTRLNSSNSIQNNGPRPLMLWYFSQPEDTELSKMKAAGISDSHLSLMLIHIPASSLYFLVWPRMAPSQIQVTCSENRTTNYDEQI